MCSAIPPPIFPVSQTKVLQRFRIYESTLDHVEEAGAGGLDEVGYLQPEHDVVSAAACVDLFQIQDAAIDEDRNSLAMSEGRGAAHGKLGNQQT